jgi:aryl-alcohol dehydrogenase-like predicted oxidoreductase/predicted kinase
MPTAIGCMRLSTVPAPDEARGIAVVHAALDGGVRVLDTADAYAPGPKEIGHNERLIAAALRSWSGDRASVRVVTKGGLVRPGGKWVPDGRARHLMQACEASLRALDVGCIDLYLLHAVDPKTPLRTSVRALAKLQSAGLVRAVGLSNVNVAQIEEARAEVEIAAVQVELGPFVDTAIRGGVATYCAAHGIELLAHRPLGGAKARAKLGSHKALASVAKRRGCSAAEVALAWTRGLAARVVPLPGPTTIEHARACGAVDRLEPSVEDLAEIDASIPAADLMRRSQVERRAADDADGDVVIVMGMPGAGKTTHARAFVDLGYARLNRDDEGGRLADLVVRLDAGLAAGTRRFVLDNTYASRATRNAVIETAWKHGVPARCVWVDTPIEMARVHAVGRMLDVHGKLLEPEEIDALSRLQPTALSPRAQIDWVRDVEAPTVDEGFRTVDVVKVERTDRDARHRGLVMIDVDHVLEGGVDARVRAGLSGFLDEGCVIAGFVWRPGADAAGLASLRETIERGFGTAFDLRCCTHPAGAPVCWCRPPMPGLVIAAMREHGAGVERSVMIGRTPHCERFAAAVGVRYLDARQWGEA